MDENDKGDFAKKLAAAGRVMARTVTRDDMDAMFQFLKDYPLRIILPAIDKALKDRDLEDLFLQTAMINGLEIMRAADDLLMCEPNKKVGCEKCNETGWVVDADPKPITEQGFIQRSQATARRCECLLAAMKNKKLKEIKKG